MTEQEQKNNFRRFLARASQHDYSYSASHDGFTQRVFLTMLDQDYPAAFMKEVLEHITQTSDRCIDTHLHDDLIAVLLDERIEPIPCEECKQKYQLIEP